MNKKIIFISIITILCFIIAGESLLLYKNRNKSKEACDNTEEIQKYKDHRNELNNKLKDMGYEEFNNKEWEIPEEGITYSLSLKFLEDKYNIEDFINYFTKELCDKDLTKIEIQIIDPNGAKEIKYNPILVC